MSSPPTFRTLGLILWLALFTGARGQSPELTRITPLSARPGERTNVTVQGKDLSKPEPLWTSFGARTEWTLAAPGQDPKSPKPDTRKLSGVLDLPGDAPLGVGFVRLPTASGMSGPLLFLVDDLEVTRKPEGNAAKPNASLKSALPVSLPRAVEGAADSGKSDFYQITPRAGEGVTIEVYAARLGSKLDPVLRLLDAGGREVAAADDTQGLAGDCRLRHVPAGGQPLFLEIRDASYAGGADYFYHIRIGDFPAVSAVYPPVVAVGVQADVRAAVEDAAPIPAVRAHFKDAKPGEMQVAMRYAPEKPAAFATIRAEEGTVVEEAVTKDSAIPRVPLPGVFVGRLGAAGECDGFELELKKDEKVTLSPLTREVASPAVLYLSVEDAKGAFVASNETVSPASATDYTLGFKAPADGLYRVRVEDMARRGGAQFVYAVRAERSTRGFDLNASSERFVAARGGSFSTKITAQRRGVSEAITLELVSADHAALPAGFRLEQNVIEKDKNETVLQVFAPADVAPGNVYHVRIIGRAAQKEETFSAVVAPPKLDVTKAQKDALLAALISMPQPPRLLREGFPVCVGPEPPDFFRVELTSEPVVLPRLVGKGAFVLRQTAIDPDFAGNAQFKFAGLPEGVSIRSEAGRGGRIKGQVDFICEVTGPVALAAGTHAFEVVASAEFKGVQKQVHLRGVRLNVVAPLEISARVEGGTAPSTKGRLRVRATRYDAQNAQPVRVSVRNYPAHVSGPESVTIGPGDTEASIEFLVGADAVPGRFESLLVSALTSVQGMEVGAEFGPVLLEVKQ